MTMYNEMRTGELLRDFILSFLREKLLKLLVPIVL